MSKRRISNKESALESLRLNYTDLNQDEFVVKCGFTRATYQRWIGSNKEPRLTPTQIAQVCRICQIPMSKFFQTFNLDISDIPKK